MVDDMGSRTIRRTSDLAMPLPLLPVVLV